MAFCSKCGTELPADSYFCPKCGTQAGPRPGDFMSRGQARHEYRRASPELSLFNSVFGGLFVILLGGLLYLASSGMAGDLVTWSNFWTYLLMGLGGMLVVRGFLEMLTRHYHWWGTIIGGMVLLVIGAAGLTVSLGGWSRYLWIAIIVAGGLLIILVGLLTYLFRR